MTRPGRGGRHGGESQQVDQGGDGEDAAPATECPEGEADDGSGGEGEEQCAHATVPFPPRASTTGRPASAQSRIPPMTSTASTPRSRSSSAARRERLPERQITTTGRDRAAVGSPSPAASAERGRWTAPGACPACHSWGSRMSSRTAVPGFRSSACARCGREQRAAGEHGDGRPVLLQRVRGVVRGVAGRHQRPQRQAGAGIDLMAVAVVDGCAPVGDPGHGGHEVGGARDAGQFRAAADVVVVDMGLDDVGYPRSAPSRRRDHLVDVTRRVDGHGRPLTAGQVAAVAESGQLDRVDEEHESLLP